VFVNENLMLLLTSRLVSGGVGFESRSLQRMFRPKFVVLFLSFPTQMPGEYLDQETTVFLQIISIFSVTIHLLIIVEHAEALKA
jgi:hypothetical protein